jgi:hypothetical protein
LPRAGCLPCLRENLFQIGNSGKDSADRDEPKSNGIGEQTRNAGLASTRRSPQDHRRQAAGSDHPRDRSLGPGQMLLSNDLLQRNRPQAVGERRIRRCAIAGWSGGQLVGEQIGHGLHKRR